MGSLFTVVASRLLMVRSSHERGINNGLTIVVPIA